MTITTDAEFDIARVADVVPVLAKHAQWAEENRRPHPEVVEALDDVGVFRLRTPRAHGGFEADCETITRVGATLATGDGGQAWAAGVYWIPTWMAGLFPDQVKEEVFDQPNTRVCGTLSPSAFATPATGGYTISGTWKFISGAHDAHWQQVVAIAETDQGPLPLLGLIPMEQLQIVDDWHTSGMRGSGSVSTVAEDVFVPAARILPLPQVLQGVASGTPSTIHHAPLLPVASASSLGAVLGLADAAQAAFLDSLEGRGITYTAYEEKRTAPVVHLHVADAVQRVQEAHFHAETLAKLVDHKCAHEETWSLLESARARGEMGAAVRRATEAIRIFASASGASAIYLNAPMQRIARDVQAIGSHALMNPDTNDELYGRVVVGLEPNTLYI